jgi:hypothetical protein
MTTPNEAWKSALETIRSGQDRLTYKQIGEKIGCSEKSARRWAKMVSGAEGGTNPHPIWQERLVALAKSHTNGAKLQAV